ncbi:hypothetical protein MMC29_001735 [Sticta canariensis]|nr:hypothetical protein [Sticta canariensis]
MRIFNWSPLMMAPFLPSNSSTPQLALKYLPLNHSRLSLTNQSKNTPQSPTSSTAHTQVSANTPSQRICPGHCLGHSVDRQLEDVVADGTHANKMRQGSRDVDNGPGAALALQQQRQQGLDHGKFAHEIDLHRLLELFDLNINQLVESRFMRADNGGIIDEQVKTAM